MDRILRNYICVLVAVALCFIHTVLARPSPQVEEMAEQIFDAARQTVTNVVGAAQGVVNQAIDGVKTQGINYVDTVQDAAKLGVETGRNVILFGETAILRVLNGVANGAAPAPNTSG